MRPDRIRRVELLTIDVQTLIREVNNEIAAKNKRIKDAEGWASDTVWDHSGTKATAALRRRSMDLTRALADLRKYE